MKNLFMVFVICFTILSLSVYATHIVGGSLEYERLGTGSLPNSSRYKIKLKLWRDASGNPWFPVNPLIECRGDTLGYTAAGFDPYVATYTGGNIYPYSGLDRMNDFSTGTGISRQFNRDFKIACGMPSDTVSVRTGAISFSNPNNNTRLWPTTGVPGYENPSYTRSGYSFNQYMQNGFGFSVGVCDASGNALTPNADRTNFTDACDADQTSPYTKLCVPQYVDSCTFVPKVFIQYAVYIRVVDLPNIPGGYHLKFNLSARNNAVLNLNNPGATSFSVYARIPDIAQLDASSTSLSSAQVNSITGLNVSVSGANIITGAYTSPNIGDRVRNSSPRFKSVPPLFVCQYNSYVHNIGINQNPKYDYSASDVDGDQIEYDLVFPTDGNDGGGIHPPKIDDFFVGTWNIPSSANINGTIFTIGMPLYATTLAGYPYPESVNLATLNRVEFKVPFTDQEPLGHGIFGATTVLGITLDKFTGLMEIKPTVPPGLYVVSVRAREFRPKGIGSRIFLSEITRDYQFNVLSCPLPAQSYIGSSTLSSAIIMINELTLTLPNNSSASAFTTNIFHWDFGRDRYVNSVNGTNLYQVRASSNYNNLITTPLGINQSGEINPTFNFSVAGTYYTKLVTGVRGGKCADSVYQAINISNTKAGWGLASSGLPYNPSIFDPYQPSVSNGFVTEGGNTLWINPKTNLIPRLYVHHFYGISATYTGIATSVNGVAQSLTDYTGYIDHFWMQPNGNRSRIPPVQLAATNVVSMIWNLGNGNKQELTLSGTNWIPINGLVSGVSITGPNTLPNANGGVNLSLPRINNNYPAGGFYNVSLTVKDQLGHSDSLQRIIKVISQIPEIITMSPHGASICPSGTVTLSVSGATFYTWMPGSFSGSNITISPSATITYTVVGSNFSTSTGTTFVTATVVPMPAVKATTSPTCEDEIATLSASGANVYEWLPGSLTGEVITVSSVNYAAIVYSVTGTDVYGCQSNDTVSLKIVDKSLAECKMTNIDNIINSMELEVYPNPSKGSFTIITNQPIAIEIFNSTGSVIIKTLVKDVLGFMIENSGIYLIKGVAGNKSIIRKIIIE